MPEADPDLPLLTAARAGDRDAFTALVRRHERRLISFAGRMLRNAAEAEEAAQEVFLKAYRALGSFRGEAKVATWLTRIATHHCLNLLRDRRRRPVAADPPGDPVGRLAETGPDPLAALEERAREAAVHAALGTLAPDQRTILLLRDLQGLSYEEVSQTLGIELGTVRSRLHRARMALREALRGKL